jgi:hypothetical protein
VNFFGFNLLELNSFDVGGDFVILNMIIMIGVFGILNFLLLLNIYTSKNKKIIIFIFFMGCLHYGIIFNITAQLFFAAFITNKFYFKDLKYRKTEEKVCAV